MSAGSIFATSCGESCDFHLCNLDLSLKPHSSIQKKKEKKKSYWKRSSPRSIETCPSSSCIHI